MYGDWSIEESDVREVWGYRVGLSVAAAGEHPPTCARLCLLTVGSNMFFTGFFVACLLCGRGMDCTSGSKV